MPELRIDRELGRLETLFITLYNIGLLRNCYSSAQYTSTKHSPKKGLEAINEACRVIIQKVAAFSTIVTIDPSRRKPLSYAQIHSPVPEPPIQVHYGVDNDPTSPSYSAFLNKAAEEPFDLADSTTPLWRVHILMSENCELFDARIIIIFSHIIMDGKTGPIWHEMLSESLCKEYQTAVSEASLPRMPPSTDAIWNMSPTRMMKIHCQIDQMIKDPARRILELFKEGSTKDQIVNHSPLNVKTIRVSESDLKRLLSEARAHKVTLTSILLVTAAYAISIAPSDSTDRNDYRKVKFDVACTTRPGHPAVTSFSRGQNYADAIKHLSSKSALDRLVYAAPTGLILKIATTAKKQFWKQCEKSRKPFWNYEAIEQETKEFLASEEFARRHFPSSKHTSQKSKWNMGERQMTGGEMRFLRKRVYADTSNLMMILSNSGAAKLQSNEHWKVRDIFRGITADESEGIFIGVTSADTLGLQISYNSHRISESRVDEFVNCWTKALRKVADGEIQESSSIIELGDGAEYQSQKGSFFSRLISSSLQ